MHLVNPNKQRQVLHIKNNHVNGMFCVNKSPQPRFVGHNPGIELGFQTLTAALLNKEATSQSLVSKPKPEMMNACDGRLAHNIRKQEITEKMRAVFRPLLNENHATHNL